MQVFCKPDFADAVAMAEAVRRGEVSPGELVGDAIARIEALNPQLNAIIHPLYDQACAAAASPDLPDGRFRGVPLVLKDLLCPTRGDPYHLGMSFLKQRRWVAPRSSFLAQKFHRAGLIVVGRSNTPELGASATTEPCAYGPTRNPWNLACSTGGSSGGSAAAVASGMVPLAHGNDMGGSIRIPASACGLVGLKPSRGRVSLGPDFGDYWGGLACEGVLTRTVRDTATMLDVMAGPMPGDPVVAPPPAGPFFSHVGADPGRLRIGLLTDWPGLAGKVHADCCGAAQAAARALEAMGHMLEPVLPAVFADENTGSLDIFGVYIARELVRWSAATGQTIGPDDVEPWTWRLAEAGRRVAAEAYVAAIERRQRHARRIARWWESHDILLTPTLARPPAKLGADPAQLVADYGAFTIPWNVTGQPALSLPAGWSKPQRTGQGLPVGVQLVAAYGREDLLIRLASQLEEPIKSAPGR